MNEPFDFMTLTGLPLPAARTILDKELPRDAYKPVPGGANLTDIDPNYMRKVLNEVFGLCGLGWGYRYSPEDVRLTCDGQGQHAVIATCLNLIFWYRLRPAHQAESVLFEIQATGSSTNRNAAYALKGMLSNALGNAVSNLGWQESVYLGRRTHQTVGRQRASTGKSQPTPQPAPVPAQPQPTMPSLEPLVLDFGRHRGEALADVAQSDPGYVRWLASNARDAQVRIAAAALVAEAVANEETEAPAAPAPQPAAMSLDEARAVTLPYGTRNHPEYQGKTLAELAQLDAPLVAWLAENARSTQLRSAAAALAAPSA